VFLERQNKRGNIGTFVLIETGLMCDALSDVLSCTRKLEGLWAVESSRQSNFSELGGVHSLRHYELVHQRLYGSDSDS